MKSACAPNSYSIYGIMNPVDNKYFYVGVTSKPIDLRLKEHYKSHNIRVRKKIASLEKKGIRPVIICLCRCSYLKSFGKEQLWIYKLINEGHVLYNKVLIP